MGGCGEGKQLIYFQIKVMACHDSHSILKLGEFHFNMTDSYLRLVQKSSKVVLAATATWSGMLQRVSLYDNSSPGRYR